MQLTLPWFNPVLNPNNKSHWRKKANARIKQKADAYWIAKQAGKLIKQDKYKLHILFCPPDNRQRDLDNCLASCKGLFDGVASAWEVNDKQFRFGSIDFGNVVKNGAVIITIDHGDL